MMIVFLKSNPNIMLSNLCFSTSIDKKKTVLSVLEKRSLLGGERRWQQIIKYSGVSAEERSKKSRW